MTQQLAVDSSHQSENSDQELEHLVETLYDPEFMAVLQQHVGSSSQDHLSGWTSSIAGGQGFELQHTPQCASSHQSYRDHMLVMEGMTMDKDDFLENLGMQQQNGEQDDMASYGSISNDNIQDPIQAEPSADISVLTQSAVNPPGRDQMDISESDTEEVKGIQIGKEHQADLPQLVGPDGDDSEADIVGTRTWDPFKLEDKDISVYLVNARAINHASNAREGLIPTGSNTPDDDFALTVLHLYDYDTEKALDYLMDTGQWNVSPLNIWSEDECQRFVAGLKLHGKDFSAIQEIVGTQTVMEVVHFYYFWKCSERHGSHEEKKKLVNHRFGSCNGWEEEDGETESLSEVSPWKRPKRERSTSPVRCLMNSRHKPSTPPPPDFELQVDHPHLPVIQGVSLPYPAPSSVNSAEVSASSSEQFSLSGFVDLCGAKRNCDQDSSLDSSDMSSANGLTDTEQKCDMSSSDRSNISYSQDLMQSEHSYAVNLSQGSDRMNGPDRLGLPSTSSRTKKNRVRFFDVLLSDSSDSDEPDQQYYVSGVSSLCSSGSTDASDRRGKKRCRVSRYKIPDIVQDIRSKKCVLRSSSEKLHSSGTESGDSETDVSEEAPSSGNSVSMPYKFPVLSSSVPYPFTSSHWYRVALNAEDRQLDQ